MSLRHAERQTSGPAELRQGQPARAEPAFTVVWVIDTARIAIALGDPFFRSVLR